MANDVWLDETGDIQVGPDGDLEISTGVDCLLQSIGFLVKTELGEFGLHPSIGTNLSLLIGRRMDEALIQEGELSLMTQISALANLEGRQVTVKGAPTSATEAIFIIVIATTGGTRQAVCTIPFNFNYGIVEEGIRAVGSESLETVR